MDDRFGLGDVRAHGLSPETRILTRRAMLIHHAFITYKRKMW
jgi:hypothetical protein